MSVEVNFLLLKEWKFIKIATYTPFKSCLLVVFYATAIKEKQSGYVNQCEQGGTCKTNQPG